MFVSIFCIKVSLNSWILLWFSAIYFWYSLDSACFSCWSLFIYIFRFFSLSNSLLIWSWLSSSCVIKVINFPVCPTLMNSISYSNLIISILRSSLTLSESLSKSGFYLKSLHNFFVLYFRMIDKFAISASTISNSFFCVIWVKFARRRTNYANLRSFSYWVLRSLLISKPAN